MQGKHLYEYAVIRVVPRVEREEFINVGIILFSKRAKFIRMKYKLDLERLRAFSCEIETELLENTLMSFGKICRGEEDGGEIARFEIPERFRWLTAVRSSCIQTSRPHPGYAENLELEVEKLFVEMVL
ncbi:MAG TPA: DUF3037 domain-containing protein [Paludibacter sp.]|nr:DUF3037 domain-containing protein [Paludibacter sp.]